MHTEISCESSNPSWIDREKTTFSEYSSVNSPFFRSIQSELNSLHVSMCPELNSRPDMDGSFITGHSGTEHVGGMWQWHVKFSVVFLNFSHISTYEERWNPESK